MAARMSFKRPVQGGASCALAILHREAREAPPAFAHIWDCLLYTSKVKVLSVGPLFAKTISNVYNNGSVASLFE